MKISGLRRPPHPPGGPTRISTQSACIAVAVLFFSLYALALCAGVTPDMVRPWWAQ
jgi:hypothetical protein